MDDSDSDDSHISHPPDEDNLLHCVKFHKKPTPTCYIETKDGFNFNAALESVFPLTDLICNYLNLSDLKTISELSNQWKEAATREYQKRNNNKLAWVQATSSEDSKVFNICTSTNFDYYIKQSGIFFIGLFDLKDLMCFHSKDIVPNKKKRTFFHIEEYLIKPDPIDFVCLTLMDLGTFSKEDSKDKQILYHGIYFPPIPNVRIKQFTYPTKLSKKNRHFDELMLDNEILDCILIFSGESTSAINKLLKELSVRQDTYPTLAGAMTWGIKGKFEGLQDKFFKSGYCYCIAFIKDVNADCTFYSASLVIGPRENFQQKATEFKKSVVMRQYSVIFRMCCIGKENGHLEGPIMKKIFPHSEHIEFYANGEIGRDRIPNLNEETIIVKKKKKNPYEVCHHYSTILLFLTWGRTI